MISTDMEGACGIPGFEPINVGASEFERARRCFTHDVNTAVQGCVDAGATETVVGDLHNLQ